MRYNVAEHMSEWFNSPYDREQIGNLSQTVLVRSTNEVFKRKNMHIDGERDSCYWIKAMTTTVVPNRIPLWTTFLTITFDLCSRSTTYHQTHNVNSKFEVVNPSAARRYKIDDFATSVKIGGWSSSGSQRLNVNCKQ